MRKKLTRLNFSGAKGVVYLSRDYRVVYNPQAIELRSVEKEHRVTTDETPGDKEIVSK
jgi:hypothetical protein